MEIEIIKTSNLTSEQVQLINKYLLPEFNEFIVQPFRNTDDSRFVFLKDGTEVVAFCRIFDTSIEFKDKQYNVLGLSMVYSIIKSKGYGKKLIKETISIADREQKLLLGNCEPKNELFYRKCGLEVLQNTIKRFVYINARNIAEINGNNSIVLIHDKNQEFLKHFEELQQENVFIFEHWW